MNDELLPNFPALNFDFSPVINSAMFDQTNITEALARIQSPVIQIPRFEMPNLQVEAARAFCEVHKAISESFRDFRIVQKDLSESIQASCRAIEQGLKQLQAAMKKAEVIGSYGWTIPMNASFPDVLYIVDAATDEATADAAFMWYFTQDGEENLKRLLSGTLSDPLLADWKPQLEEAVACFKEGKYWACANTLSSVVDGLCAERFSLETFHVAKQRERYFNTRLQSLAPDSLTRVLWQSFIAFVNTFFQYTSFQKGVPPPPVLNRHRLLHGRGSRQPRREDCIRLLQAIETITGLDV